nr:transglycosylase SLT domain-containing protein [Candidatus Levybacteria bacterium]
GGDGPLRITRRGLFATAAAAGAAILYGANRGDPIPGSPPPDQAPAPVPPPEPGVASAAHVPDGARRVPSPSPSPSPEASPAAVGESPEAATRRKEIAKKLIKEFPLMRSQENLEPSSLPFLDDDANEVAKELGITHVGELFDIPSSVIPKLTAWLEEDALRIYAPKVYEHDALLQAKAKEFGVPVNFLKTLAVLESGGDAAAGPENGSAGQGLMQVEDIHFREDKDEHDDYIPKSREQKIEPAYNVDRAITQVIKDYEVRANAKSFAWQNPAEGHRGSDAYKWLKIAQAYNGGEKAMHAVSAYDESAPTIAKVYFDHVLRFALTAQIAAGLKKRGFDDAEVAAKLTSYEVEVRAEVLEKALQEHPLFNKDDEDTQANESKESYKTYSQIKDILGEAIIDQQKASQIKVIGGKTIQEAYRDALQKTNYGKTGDIQLNPALRIWLAHDPSRGLWKELNDDLYDWQEAYAGDAHGNIVSWRPVPTAVPAPLVPEATPVPSEEDTAISPPEVKPESPAEARVKPEAPAEPEPTPKLEAKPESKPVSPSTTEVQPAPPGEKQTIPKEYMYREQDEAWWDDKRDVELTCGPTSVAMVVSTLLGKRITPTEIDKAFQNEWLDPNFGYVRIPGRDTVFRSDPKMGEENGVPNLIRKKYGLKVNQLFDRANDGDVPEFPPADLQLMKDALASGSLLVASSGSSKFLDKDEDGVPLAKKRFSANGADHIFVIEDIHLQGEKIMMTVVDSWDGKRKRVPITDMYPPAYVYAVKKGSEAPRPMRRNSRDAEESQQLRAA